MRTRSIQTLVAVLSLSLLLGRPAVAAMLEEGQPMPEWSLSDHTGATVSSKDLAGKTYVLWFYPKAQTPGCTVEGQNFRDEYPKFEKADVEVFGVSFDTPEENAAFVKAEGFPFRLLSDDGSLGHAVGSSTPDGPRYARRISYVVGPDGTVRKAYGSVVPAAHAKEVLADLAAPNAGT